MKIKINDTVAAKLDAFCLQKGISPTAIVHMAIDQYFQTPSNGAQPPKESSHERKEARDAVLRQERSARMAAESAARFAESEAYIAKIWENAPYLSTGKKNPNYRPENPYVAPTKPDSMTTQYPSGEVPEYDNLDDILGT